MVHQHRHVHALLDGKARRTGRQIAKAGLVVDIFRAAILLRDGGQHIIVHPAVLKRLRLRQREPRLLQRVCRNVFRSVRNGRDKLRPVEDQRLARLHGRLRRRFGRRLCWALRHGLRGRGRLRLRGLQALHAARRRAEHIADDRRSGDRQNGCQNNPPLFHSFPSPLWRL